MSFFERNRRQLASRGIDPGRLPPGQYSTDRFPVLHAGGVPEYPSLDAWTLELSGLVARPVTLTWAQLHELPGVDVVVDIHCVTKWSKFDTPWRGVAFDTLLERAGGPSATATHVLCLSEHGYPARFLVPSLYFWKSAKWLRGLELLPADQPGFWERNGYHMHGDPFLEQRFTGD